MFTLFYKGAYIQGTCDKTTCYVQYGPALLRRGPFPSVASAKRFIREAIKNGDHEEER